MSYKKVYIEISKKRKYAVSFRVLLTVIPLESIEVKIQSILLILLCISEAGTYDVDRSS